MSDDAYDFNTGRGLASGGGTPDWNSQSQVDGWNAQRNYEAMQSSMNPPQSSTSSFPSYDGSPSWSSSSSSDQSYSSPYRGGGSYSGSRAHYQASWKPFNVMILTLAGIVGAVIGYSNVPRYAPTEDFWLTSGGGALGGMLLAGAALALIALTFKVIKFLISTFVGGIRWLIRKLPERLRPVARMMGIAGLLGGAAGYLMEASQHGSQPAIWTTTGIFASGAVMIVAAVTAAVTMTLATIRFLFKGLAGATRWLVGKSRQSFRAVPR